MGGFELGLQGLKRATIATFEASCMKFPVTRVLRLIKCGKNVSPGTCVYASTVLRFLTAEKLELLVKTGKDNKKKAMENTKEVK